MTDSNGKQFQKFKDYFTGQWGQAVLKAQLQNLVALASVYKSGHGLFQPIKKTISVIQLTLTSILIEYCKQAIVPWCSIINTRSIDHGGLQWEINYCQLF